MTATTDLEPVSGELVPTSSRTLFATDDPDEVLDRARSVARALKGALDQGGMVQKIGNNEHVLIDGWQTLGSMLGVAPHVVWSRRLPEDGPEGWEARAEAITVEGGRVVGAAEAMVTKAERNWRRADDYALRSMAQTRAMSKALRAPLGFIVALGGLNPTPGEEANAEPADAPSEALPPWAMAIDEAAVDRFDEALTTVLTAAGVPAAKHVAWYGVGSPLVAFCEGDIPACVARFAKLLTQAIANPNVPPPPEDTPAAASPDVPPEEV